VAPVQKTRKQNSNKGVEGMHRGGRASALTAATILVLAVASGCSGSPEPAASPTSTVTVSASPSSTPSLTPSPSPTSSPSLSPTSDTERAATDAEELIREYYQVIDQLGLDPSVPLTALEEVAISKDLSVRQRQFERERRDGWTQTGDTKIVELKVQSVNLDNSDPSTGRVPAVQVDVCVDVTDVDVRDASGSSVVTADRPDTNWTRHTVSNYSWDTDPEGAWRVSTSVDLEQPPCQPAA
jgi:hypothetical protein